MDNEQYEGVIKWKYYGVNVLSGHFKEFDENGDEDYTDRNTFERAVDEWGINDAIKIIDYNKARGKGFTMNNLGYVYDWEDWKGDKNK